MQLYTIQQVSQLIHKSVGSIYNDLHRNPLSLPPRHRLPGSSRVFFRDVDAWISGELTLTPTPSEPKPKSRRGRPSHASKSTK